MYEFHIEISNFIVSDLKWILFGILSNFSCTPVHLVQSYI